MDEISKIIEKGLKQEWNDVDAWAKFPINRNGFKIEWKWYIEICNGKLLKFKVIDAEIIREKLRLYTEQAKLSLLLRRLLFIYYTE